MFSDLGQKEAAIAAHDQALNYKPDYHTAWYNKAHCHALMGEVIEAVDCLSQAISLDSKYREMAKTDSDFDAIRDDDWFRTIVEEPSAE